MQEAKQSGFTIIELMITIAVLGVLLAFAVPNLNDFFDKRRVIKLSEEIYSDLQYARTEALSAASNRHVAEAGGVTVRVTRASDTDWAIGTTVRNWRVSDSASAACDTAVTDPANTGACFVISDDNPDASSNYVDGVDVNLNGTLDTEEIDTGDRVLRVVRSADHTGTIMSAFAADEPFGSNEPNEITFGSIRGTAMHAPSGPAESGAIKIASNGGYQMCVTVGVLGQVNICSPPGTGNVPGYPDCNATLHPGCL